MKFITLLTVSISVYASAQGFPAFATSGTKEEPVYKQCTVSLPQGNIGGVCKETGEKYFQIFTCGGELLAFVEPGALPTTYEATCGANYKGYPNG